MRGMKMGALVTALAFCVAGAHTVQAQTVVNQVKLGVGGVLQGNDGANFIIEKFKAKDVDLINLARAMPPGIKPPANIVLALTTDCTDGASQLVVWNMNTNMELAQVSNVFSITDDSVNGDKNGQLAGSLFVESMDFADSGDNTWGIEGGEIFLSGSIKWADVNGMDCPVAMKATMAGTMSIWIFGQQIDTLAVKAKMGAKGPIFVGP